jgi:hypothetical protein
MRAWRERRMTTRADPPQPRRRLAFSGMKGDQFSAGMAVGVL